MIAFLAQGVSTISLTSDDVYSRFCIDMFVSFPAIYHSKSINGPMSCDGKCAPVHFYEPRNSSGKRDILPMPHPRAHLPILRK